MPQAVTGLVRFAFQIFIVDDPAPLFRGDTSTSLLQHMGEFVPQDRQTRWGVGLEAARREMNVLAQRKRQHP
jgi:hypothetical protein